MRIVPASIDSASLGLANAFINPEMRWAQRNPGAATFTACASNTLPVDRMVWNQAGAGVVTAGRAAAVTAPLVVGGPLITHHLQTTVTTADASIASGDVYGLAHKIEGYNAAPYMERQFTFGFFVYATVPGIYCVAINNSGSNRAFIGEYTINNSNTWEWKTITVPPSPNGGTWDRTTGIGMYFHWTQACGVGYQIAAGAWTTTVGVVFGSANQVNNMATAGNVFRITGLDINLGSTCPMYRKPRPDGEELLLCQRYMWKNYPPDTAPANNVAKAYLTPILAGTNIAANAYYIQQDFPVPMRATPTPTLFQYGGVTPVTITNGVVQNSLLSSNGGGQEYAANSAQANSITALTVVIQNVSGGNLLVSGNQLIFLGMHMSAELP